MQTERLIKLQAAAEMLGKISVRTVRRKIAAGELSQPIRVGKFSMLFLSDIVAAIERLKSERDKKIKL